MSSLISTTTPLVIAGVYTSSVQSLTRATQITGTVFADTSGTLSVQQSGDGTNFDVIENIAVSANIGQAIEVDVISQYFRVVYTNGSTLQTVFRLYVDIRDPYGDFLIASQAPSEGGAWIVLYYGSQGYQVVDRFDGDNGWGVNGAAAISTNRSGKYASFLISDATVSLETLQMNSEHGPDSF